MQQAFETCFKHRPSIRPVSSGSHNAFAGTFHRLKNTSGNTSLYNAETIWQSGLFAHLSNAKSFFTPQEASHRPASNPKAGLGGGWGRGGLYDRENAGSSNRPRPFCSHFFSFLAIAHTNTLFLMFLYISFFSPSIKIVHNSQ